MTGFVKEVIESYFNRLETHYSEMSTAYDARLINLMYRSYFSSANDFGLITTEEYMNCKERMEDMMKKHNLF